MLRSVLRPNKTGSFTTLTIFYAHVKGDHRKKSFFGHIASYSY